MKSNIACSNGFCGRAVEYDPGNDAANGGITCLSFCCISGLHVDVSRPSTSTAALPSGLDEEVEGVVDEGVERVIEDGLGARGEIERVIEEGLGARAAAVVVVEGDEEVRDAILLVVVVGSFGPVPSESFDSRLVRGESDVAPDSPSSSDSPSSWASDVAANTSSSLLMRRQFS